MIVHTTGFFAMLSLLIVNMISLFLFVTTLRLVLGQLPAARPSRLFHALQELIDPVPKWVGRRLVSWRRKACPSWLPWALVIAAGLIIRHLLVATAIALA